MTKRPSQLRPDASSKNDTRLKKKSMTPLPRRLFEVIRHLPKATPRHKQRPHCGLLLSVLRQTVGNMGYESTAEGKARREDAERSDGSARFVPLVSPYH